MNEFLPPPTADGAYKPISGFALSGLIVSAVFAALVLLSAAVAIIKGAPIFYPLWILLIPCAACVLCFVGRGQIVGPDATRDGLRLANLGLGLALFSGLGYAAYFITVGMAVAKQANDFVAGDAESDRGFLAHLTRGGANPTDLDIAFLLTRPATARIKLRPGDDETLVNTYDHSTMDAAAGELTRFRRSILARMLGRAGDKAVIEPLGVRDWEYDKASYKVARNYRIGTPEAVLDMVLQAESTEAEAEGQLRQWFVNLNRSPTLSKELTPLGKTIEKLWNHGRRFVESDWRLLVRAGKAVPDAAAFDKTNWAKLFPDTEEFLKAKKNVYREYYRDQARGMFQGKGLDFFQANDDSTSWPAWGHDNAGRFWMEQPIRITIPGAGSFPTVAAEGSLKLRSKEPFDPAQGTPPFPEWTVDELTIHRARAMKGPS